MYMFITIEQNTQISSKIFRKIDLKLKNCQKENRSEKSKIGSSLVISCSVILSNKTVNVKCVSSIDALLIYMCTSINL